MAKQTEAAFVLAEGDLSELRGFFVEENGIETTLNDEQISALAEANDGKELSTAEWVEAMEALEESLQEDEREAQPQTPAQRADAVVISNKVHAAAVTFGNVAAADAELSGLVNEAVIEDEKRSTRPLVLMRHLQRIHGDDLGSFPVVGSDAEMAKTTNLPPDKYSYKTDNDETVSGSFYRDYALSFPIVKEAAEAMTALKSKDGQGQGGTIMNKKLIKKWEGRVEAGVRNVRLAFRILQRLSEINSECGQVEAYHSFEFERTDGGGYKKVDGERIKVYDTSTRPIYLGSTDPEVKDFNYFTVSQILGVKTDKVKALGGGWAAIEAAMKRVKKDGATLPAVELATVGSFGNNMRIFLQGEGNMTAYRKILDKPAADNLIDGLVQLQDALIELLDPYTTMQAGRPSRISVIRNKQVAAEKKVLAGKAA